MDREVESPVAVLEDLRRFIGAARLLSVEDRAHDLVIRLGAEDSGTRPRLTCVLHRVAVPILSRAESAVAALLCDGLTSAQIAVRRGVSVNTIKTQVRQIFRKVGVESRVALVRRMHP